MGARNRQKVYLITGATNGIGRAAAEELAAPGRVLVLHGRNRDKLEAAREAALERCPEAEVVCLTADFSNLDEVRDLAGNFADRFSRLDVLFNNAGVLTDERRSGADGFELTFTVNHLAPMLLTWSLLPQLEAAAPARIIFNSSSAAGDARLRLDDLQSEHWHSGWAAYACTKLANILMSNLLAEKLADRGIVSNAFCPGLVNTGLITGNREFSQQMISHINERARPPADGARTALYLATEPAAQDISGAFFLKSHGDGTTPLQINWDRDFAAALWERTEELLRPWLTEQEAAVN
jgi:NAD(P)-dependent dehydrogenase (short-subunit alcohol dehydrogenase family)